MRENETQTSHGELVVPHPYWCDDCGEKAALTIPGCEIKHDRDCVRQGENPTEVYRAAVAYCKATGKTIP